MASKNGLLILGVAGLLAACDDGPSPTAAAAAPRHAATGAAHSGDANARDGKTREGKASGGETTDAGTGTGDVVLWTRGGRVLIRRPPQPEE